MSSTHCVWAVALCCDGPASYCFCLQELEDGVSKGTPVLEAKSIQCRIRAFRPTLKFLGQDGYGDRGQSWWRERGKEWGMGGSLRLGRGPKAFLAVCQHGVCGGGVSWQLLAPLEEVSGYQSSHLSTNTLRLLLKPTTNQINKLASGVWLPLFLTSCLAQPPCPA